MAAREERRKYGQSLRQKVGRVSHADWDPNHRKEGVFLVQVQRVHFRRRQQKPYYTLSLDILEPSRFAGHVISSRLYCSPKALWKLNWFLRDFGYDAEQLGRDEVDETQLVGLKGVVKISHLVLNGSSLPRFDGFAPVGRWKELSPENLDSPQVA